MLERPSVRRPFFWWAPWASRGPTHRRADRRTAFVGRPSRWHRPCTGCTGCAGPALSRPKGGVGETPQRPVATTLHFSWPPTVHSSTIRRRTPAGEAELAAPAQGLSLTQRRFLTLLDTSCDVGQMRLDRKSTRLNSSHQIISSAVFCL